VEMDKKKEIGKIRIGENCYVSENSIVLPGVTIGSNVIVAAGSVVNKDIAPNSCIAGVPARFYSKYDEFIEKQKAKIQDRPIFKYEDIHCRMTEDLKKQIIDAVEDGDAYVKGFIGRFPTSFNDE